MIRTLNFYGYLLDCPGTDVCEHSGMSIPQGNAFSVRTTVLDYKKQSLIIPDGVQFKWGLWNLNDVDAIIEKAYPGDISKNGNIFTFDIFPVDTETLSGPFYHEAALYFGENKYTMFFGYIRICPNKIEFTLLQPE